jgi:hypothetical protein
MLQRIEFFSKLIFETTAISHKCEIGQKSGQRAGLPDGLLSYQKSLFWVYILEGLGMGNIGMFYDRLY